MIPPSAPIAVYTIAFIRLIRVRISNIQKLMYSFLTRPLGGSTNSLKLKWINLMYGGKLKSSHFILLCGFPEFEPTTPYTEDLIESILLFIAAPVAFIANEFNISLEIELAYFSN